MRQRTFIRALLCLIGIAIGAASVAAIGPSVGERPRFYTAAQLKNIDVQGVRLGMPLRDAEARLARRGMVREVERRDSFPADGSFGAVRYTTWHGVPLVDLTYHRVRGVLVVTGLGLQEDFGFTSAAEKDRLLRTRYAAPTYVDRRPYGSHYHWIGHGWPSDERQLEVTGSCLSVFMNCVAPGVPRDCPANLIRRGSAMAASFGGGARGGSRLYVNLWDTASQFEAVYRGRRRLPARPICAQPIVN